jgi:hypothetical protein
MTSPALILIFLLAVVPRASSAQDSAFGSCPCTLNGHVLNSVTGAPIRNALVESNAGSPNSTLTDSDGAFHFDNLPAGSVSLSVIKPGFLPATPFLTPSPSFRVAPDAPLAVIKLVPAGIVRGHIADDRGLPLENFSVQLLSRAPGSSEPTRQSFFTIVTNDLGNFRVPDLPAGSYYLLVAPQDAQIYRHATDEIPSGYPRVYYPGVLDLSAATPIKVSAGRESIADLTLAAKSFIRLSGKVSGYPPGSSVQLYLGLVGDSEAAKLIKFDPHTGAFETDWVPPGTLMIQATAEGDFSNARSAPLTGHLSVSATSSMSGLNLVMLPEVNLPVSVEGPGRREDLARLAVQLIAVETGNIQNAEQMTKDSDPSLPAADRDFLSIPQGTYHFDVSSTADDPYYVESARSGSTDLLTSDLVVDSSTSAHPIEIVVRHGAATLSGSVNLKDAARGAVVCLFPEKSSAKPLFQTVGANVSFRFDALSPGDYRIAAVDSLSGVDFANPASLKKISSAGSAISLSPSQSANLTLDLVAVEE